MSLLAVTGLLWTFWPWLCLASSEIHVTCVLSEVCVLPCKFTKSRDELIHWYKGTTVVHSFYNNMDQLGLQDPAYKYRTSMEKEQVAEGNATLSLQSTNLLDGGRYRCYCSTAQGKEDSYVMVEVKAPVRSVDMKVLGEEVHCSSQNIYPKPHVSWATDPPTTSETLKATTESSDSGGLYTLDSRVGILGNLTHYKYICSISVEGSSQLWTASIKHQDIIEDVEGRALSIPCLAPNDLQNFTLTWAFMKTGQPNVFLNFNSRTGKVANNWTDRVQLDPDQAQSGDGSLQLQTSQAQEMNGTFICTFSNESSRHTVYTSIRVTGAGNRELTWLWAVLPAVFIAVIIILACVIWRRRNGEKDKKQKNERQQGQKMLAVHQPRDEDDSGNEQNDPEEEKLTSEPVTQNPDST